MQEDTKNQELQYGALKEVFEELRIKGVPCYFFNRVGEKKDHDYDTSAKLRIENGLSFPVMYENREKYKEEFQNILKDKYSEEYVEELGHIPQIIKRSGIYGHEDIQSKYVNVIGGKRIVINQPEKSDTTIHIYGRCGVFGYAVEDEDNIPSILQNLVITKGYNNIKIVNHGLWGGSDFNINHNLIFDSQTMKKGDIVVIYMSHYPKEYIRISDEASLKYFNCTNEFYKHPESKWCFYDKPGHMTREGYNLVAKMIWDYLRKDGFLHYEKDIITTRRSDLIRKYIEAENDNEFEQNLSNYLREIKSLYPEPSSETTCGAIIMNCNPFTKGHQYLIEYAAKRVKRLYVFVLQEDKSYFKFEDRLKLVRSGTSHLKNVIVLPSGEFMISAYTLPHYFMKDYVDAIELDVTKDLDTFSKKIAPALNITIRFAGEEPIDIVTKSYNDNMRRILPEYGIEFCEIPRLSVEGNNIISASKVRCLLADKKFEEICQYVPKTTYDFLIKNFS